MKKIALLVLSLMLALSFAACGSKPDSEGAGGGADQQVSPRASDNSDSSDSPDSSDEDKIDALDIAESLLEEAAADNSFSVAAAAAAWKQRGINVSDVEPDWEYTVNEDAMHAYGDTSSYGHGVIRFTKKTEGYLSDEDYRAWVAKAFKATADIADNGFNIQGFDWGDGIVPRTLDEVFDSFVQTWSYIYNDTIMNVYVEIAKEKESELEGDPYWDEEKGETVWPEWTHYYNGVQLDIGTGSQGEWNWDDLDKIFEEYEDQIKDALKDYAN